MPKLQTLVSAVNMRRKMGPAQHEACALAYLSILRMEAVGAELRALVEKNLAECLGTLPEGARARLEAAVDARAIGEFTRLAAEAAGFVRLSELLNPLDKELAGQSWASRRQARAICTAPDSPKPTQRRTGAPTSRPDAPVHAHVTCNPA